MLPLRLILLLSVLALAACQPADPPDPLDWKVSARSPDDYTDWAETHVERLPSPLRDEYVRAFHLIAISAPRGLTPRSMAEVNNPLCQLIHRRTVRNLIVEGYERELTEIQYRISGESDRILRNVKASGSIDDPEKRNHFEEVAKVQAGGIERLHARTREIKARLRELAPR